MRALARLCAVVLFLSLRLLARWLIPHRSSTSLCCRSGWLPSEQDSPDGDGRRVHERVRGELERQPDTHHFRQRRATAPTISLTGSQAFGQVAGLPRLLPGKRGRGELRRGKPWDPRRLLDPQPNRLRQFNDSQEKLPRVSHWGWNEDCRSAAIATFYRYGRSRPRHPEMGAIWRLPVHSLQHGQCAKRTEPGVTNSGPPSPATGVSRESGRLEHLLAGKYKSLAGWRP